MSDPRPEEQGHILGPFTLLRMVGEGANGDVWGGIHTDSGLKVAVKVIKPELAMNARAESSFRNEVRAVAALNHPHIVTVYDYGTIPAALEARTKGALSARSPFLVMEWASGGTLDDMPAPEDWPTFRDTLLLLLHALGHAHSFGVIHRDLKPANILFCTEQDLRPGIKLADFGLARHHEPEKDVRRLAGTPHYMAPEQWRSNVRDQGPWTDIYALGCLAYRLVTGKGPFRASTVKDMRERHLRDPVPLLRTDFPIPRGFQGWINRMMSKRIESRFQRSADAASALQELDQEGAYEPSRLPIGEHISDQGRYSAAMVGAGLGLYGLRGIPLVGRAGERREMWRALDKVRAENRARVLLLTGTAGTGKSRMAEWLGRTSDERGTALLVGATHADGGGPGDGLQRMVTRSLRCLGLEADRERVRERVTAWLRARGEQDTYLREALCEVICGGDSEPGTVQFETPRERHAVIRRYLELITQERPVILWLDDVQWGADAISFVHHLLQAQEHSPHPILVLMTAEQEALRDRPLEGRLLTSLELYWARRFKQLPVPPLGEKHERELNRRLVGLDEDLNNRISDHIGGNPLFAVQLVAEWAEQGAFTVGDQGFVLAQTAELPDDLGALWRTRIGSLMRGRPDDDQRALEIAAALGQEVDPSEWQAACERAWAIPSTDLVDGLLGRRLAQTGEDGPQRGWRLVHSTLRQALLKQARDAGRDKIHNRVCAEMLLQRQTPGKARRIARHLQLAGRPRRALAHLLEAADGLMLRRALPQAAVMLSEHDSVLASLGLSESDGRRAVGALAWARLARLQGDRKRAEANASVAIQVARLGTDSGQLAAALEMGGRLLLDQGELDDAQEMLTESEAICRGGELGPVLARVLRALGELARRRTQASTATRLLTEARDLYAAEADLRGSGSCCRLLARVARDAKQPMEARRHLEQAYGRYERAGDLKHAGACLAELGDLAREGGDVGQARTFYREALHRYRMSAGANRTIANLEAALERLQ